MGTEPLIPKLGKTPPMDLCPGKPHVAQAPDNPVSTPGPGALEEHAQ